MENETKHIELMSEMPVASPEFAQWLFKQSCDFTAGATTVERIPLGELPEVAFAGRSNVGKSSLINALTNQNHLARVSHTPGRTQQLNFFTLGERLVLVDLPGYGYASAPKQAVRMWTDLTYLYLKGRPQLQRVYVLIDSRHGLKPIDKKLMQELDSVAVSYQIVLTKLDKISQTTLTRLISSVEQELKTHPAAFPSVLATSAHSGTGIEEARMALSWFALKS